MGGEGDVPVFMFATKGWSVYAGKLGYTLEKNAWYHVAGVFENNTLSLYIDGFCLYRQNMLILFFFRRILYWSYTGGDRMVSI